MPRVLHPDLPHFISFGEALTDFVRQGTSQWRSSCGGSPWNLAVAMSTLGQLSAFAGAVGSGPFGQELWQASQDANLDMRFIQQLPYAPLLAMVHATEPLSYEFIGENSADLHFRPAGLPAGWQKAVRWAHFGSIALAREPLAARLLTLARALHGKGIRISYDPNFRAPPMDARYDDTLEAMCRIASVIKVSDEDLRGLFRVSDHRSGLAQIAAWNPGAWLLLTRGADGATLYHGSDECTARPPEVAVVDAVGAGDAALAGLLDSLMRQPDAGTATHLRRALAAGALACTRPGFQPPRPAEVEALAAAVVPLAS
ncbi:MAG: carbohydrate kinase [Roseateles depolymerans]|uniref:Carbohydrate kinase n=1 Tax=Roseateles depolymerans TaxID=76731 RepID=A0A2W5FFM0_9BURK|nr:MAG: carbohydrate kinase [Roseateles depolymerans]